MDINLMIEFSLQSLKSGNYTMIGNTADSSWKSTAIVEKNYLKIAPQFRGPHEHDAQHHPIIDRS